MDDFLTCTLLLYTAGTVCALSMIMYARKKKNSGWFLYIIALLALGGQGRLCPFGVCSTRPNQTKLVAVSGRDTAVAGSDYCIHCCGSATFTAADCCSYCTCPTCSAISSCPWRRCTSSHCPRATCDGDGYCHNQVDRNYTDGYCCSRPFDCDRCDDR